MLAVSVNALLQLGLPVNGGLEDKKKRLFHHIGPMVLSVINAFCYFMARWGLIYLQAFRMWRRGMMLCSILRQNSLFIHCQELLYILTVSKSEYRVEVRDELN